MHIFSREVMSTISYSVRSHASYVTSAIVSTGVFLYSLTCLLLSLLFSTSVSGHIFRIGGVRGLTVRHVHILFPPHPQKSISPGTSLSFAALSIALCIPSLQSPTYLTLTLQSALLRSTLSTVSTRAPLPGFSHSLPLHAYPQAPALQCVSMASASASSRPQ